MMTVVADAAPGLGIQRQEPARARAVEFDDFYRSEYSGSLQFAYVLTGRLPVAEEIVQEAFLAAYRRWDRVGARPDPGKYVRHAVANACTSWWRRRTTELRLVTRLHSEPGRPIELPERDERVLAAVRRLPGRQREAVALALLEDRSVADTAEILGCSEETVRTHLRRGRRALATMLDLPEDDA